MPIDYRYHIGSFIAIFVALLLGILIGIGLAPDQEYVNTQVTALQQEFRKGQKEQELRLGKLAQETAQYKSLATEAVAGVIRDRLKGRRVAIILDRDFGHDPVPDLLRMLMKDSGATLVSTTTITRDFVELPEALRKKVAQRLDLSPQPGVHVRSVIAEALAKALAAGQGEFVMALQEDGLVKSSADSTYDTPIDSVLLVGGPPVSRDASPERIDLPMVAEFLRAGINVVGCESSHVSTSCIALYRSKGIPTVDNADMLAGRMAIVLSLAGAKGHFGVKDTADRLVPALSGTGRP